PQPQLAGRTKLRSPTSTPNCSRSGSRRQVSAAGRPFGHHFGGRAASGSGGGCLGLVEVPADDPEAVVHRGLEPAVVEAPAGSGGGGQKPPAFGFGRGHDPKESFDLVEVADQLG